MSVATQHSPFPVGSKRLYETEENEDRLQRLDATAASQKRFRSRGSTSVRCAGDRVQHAYIVGHATVAALRGLFPGMSDKVIADVLAEYGDNIDAAIKHLTDLRLSTAGTSAAPEASPHQADEAHAADQQPQQDQDQQTAQQSGADPLHGLPAASYGGRELRTAEDWVDVVVQEMATAKDMADARSRASKVLQAFELAVLQHSKQAGSGLDLERLRAQLADAVCENQLLKRAVAIQNSRMQELSGKEAEVAHLRQMLEAFQQKVHTLEVQNYSLALHLKQATDGKDALQAGYKNPDIF